MDSLRGKKQKSPYDGFEEYEFADPSRLPREEVEAPPTIWEKMYRHPIFKGLAALGVLLVGIKAVWSMTEAFEGHFRILFSVFYVLGFIYLCAEMFTLTVVFFASLSSLVLFVKGFLRLNEHQWTVVAVFYTTVIPASLIIGWYFYDKNRLRCEKCRATLHERDLLDEETVSMYKCPRCKHITQLKW
jgi:hypothetical protein